MVTRITASSASASDERCAVGGAVARQLERHLAMAVMQAGFPNAAPPPVQMDPTPNPQAVALKPIFTVGIATKLLVSGSSRLPCLAAMRADVALGRSVQLVLWSSPMIILEARAGSAPQRPSEDLTEAVRRMMDEMARVAVLAWRGVEEPMSAPD